jgi:hypothetical protein
MSITDRASAQLYIYYFPRRRICISHPSTPLPYGNMWGVKRNWVWTNFVCKRKLYRDYQSLYYNRKARSCAVTVMVMLVLLLNSETICGD